MKNYRVYYQHNIKIDQTILLPRHNSHHLINVLRLKKDNYVNIFNCTGEWLTQIIDSHKSKTKILVLKQIKSAPILTKWVHLFYAPLKHIPNNFLITKATELGINEITQVVTSNTNNKPLEIDKIKIKTIEASEQCNRLTLPIINSSIKLENLIKNLNFNLLWLNEQQLGEELNHYLLKNLNIKHINILVGPEGGFSNNEVNILKSNNFLVPVYLKGNILRAETASIAALSLSIYL